MVKSLSGMVLGLQQRFLIDEIYMTVSCNASTPMSKRDVKKNDIIDKILGVSGTTQGMLLNVLRGLQFVQRLIYL